MLTPGRTVTLGRAGGPDAASLDVDLWPDRQVSRVHARVQYADSGWSIEDAGSKHGTLVDGQPLAPGRPTPLRPWSEITVGETTLFLAPPGWHRLTGQDLVLDLEIVGAVSSSLAHAGLPILQRLVARSRSDTRRPGGRLDIALEPCIEPLAVVLPPLDPGASATLRPGPLVTRYDVLEGQMERSRRRLSVTLDGVVLRGDPVECWLLPHNEWSTLPEHRRALATFALPNHPSVSSLCLDVVAALAPDASAEATLGALFGLLSERWWIAYRIEPPHWGADSQKVRLPHQILLDEVLRRGEATCIDLALLVAAGLENLGLQPIIAILDMGEWWHALVGCWDPPRPSLESLYLDVRQLLDGAVWIDPTCLTRDEETRRPFEAARTEASAYLRERPLIFALDVAAARQEGITPLPFAGTPSWSPGAGRAMTAARDQAAARGGQVCSAALLAGLLAAGDGPTRRLVATTLGDPDAALRTIVASLPRAVPGLDATPGYRQVLDLARSRARAAGSPVVLETHLLGALLAVRSASLERALGRLGSDQGRLAEALGQLDGTGPEMTNPRLSSWG